jgi:hypothetical protein
MNDIPEHFYDPLMQEIMKDPVLLPSSGVNYFYLPLGRRRSHHNKKAFIKRQNRPFQ